MSTPPSVLHAARRREKAIWQGTVASFVAKGATAACGLAQVPIAVNYLGGEMFGLWMTLSSALAFMAFADLGIGAGVQNETAALLGRDALPEARRTLVNGLAVLALAGLVLGAVLLALVAVLPWQTLLKLPDEQRAGEARRGLWVLAVLFCANLPLTGVARLAFGAQLGWLANAWYAVVSALTLIAVVAGRGLGLGFVAFVAAAALPQIAGHLCLTVHVFKKLGWRFAGLPRPTAGEMRRLLRAGLPFVLPQLGALALTSAPAAIISSVLGTAAVTPYSLCQRLLSLFGVVQQILLTQLWPAYTEARARGDGAWLLRNYGRSLVLSAVVVALPQLVFFAWGGPAIAVWTGGAVTIAAGLALAFGLQAAAVSMGQPPAFLLNSEGRMRGQAIYGTLSVALALGAMPWALSRWGIAGAPLVLLVTWVAVYLPGVHTEAAKSLRAEAAGAAGGTLR